MSPKKTETKKIDGWADKQSYLTERRREDGRMSCHGVYVLHGMSFKFHITEQRTGAYVMRGAVSPIDPMTGKSVDIGAREKAKYFDVHPEKREIRCPEVLISHALYTNTTNIEEIKATVAEAVQRLYHDYGARLHHVYGVVARPNTILPIIASTKHVDQFLSTRHKNLGESSYRNYKGDIINIASSLPAKAMCEISMKEVEKTLRRTNASVRKQKLLFEFWGYCIDKGICVGKNPVPIVEKKRKSPEALMRAVKRKDRLNPVENDKFHEMLMLDLTGPACGTALMLDGGYAGEIAADFRWGDLIFGDPQEYVCVSYNRPDLAGATHNYTAPIFPSGALVLRARYERLVEQYGKEQVAEMPVASQITNPKVPCGAAVLKQHARLLLLKKLFSYEDVHVLSEESSDAVSNRVLLNTYKAMVNRNLGLENEPGIVKFLLHQSLSGSVTDDNYASFTSEESRDFLFALMSYTRPEIEIEDKDLTVLVSNKKEKRVVFPETTRQRVGCLATFTLQPGEELIFAASHGTTGSVKARGFTADGKIRRKTSNRR